MIWRRFRGGPSAARTNRPPHLDHEAAQGSYSRQRAEAVSELLGMWERRLRGYDMFECPVALEPAFLPFHPPVLLDEEVWEELRVEPHLDVPLAFTPVLMPTEQKVTPDAFAALLGAWSALWHPVALEIVATDTSIVFQITCAQNEQTLVQESLRLAFPLAQSTVMVQNEVTAELPSDALHAALSGIGSTSPDYRVIDLGLGRAANEPLPLLSSWSPDPLLALVGVLGALNQGEVAGFQVLCSPARQAWGAELNKLVALWRDWGDKDESDARSRKTCGQEMEKTLRQKLASPLWMAAPRVFAASANGDASRTLDLCGRMAASLSGTHSQALLALDDEGYEVRDHLLDVLARRTRRSGLLISAGELGTLWHPPAETLDHPRLIRALAPQLPAELQGLSGARLGQLDTGSSREEAPLVLWPDAWRTRHFYTLGATRMGKSTLLLNMIAQDLEAGRGLCLIDPHGDLARDVMALVPPEREDDVLFLDIADAEFPPAIGLLDARDEWEERLLVSDLLSILRRLFASSWGDRLEHLLRHALLTLLADRHGKHTLRDVRPLLSDEEFRSRVVAGMRDPDLRLFWAREFPAYPASALSPIYNKLGLLFSSPLVRNIAGGSASRLHFGQLMREKKVLLVDLSAGKIGQDNAHFLGALLVSRLQLSAMHALRLDRAERTPFTLYVDEFHAFVVSSFETILSEAGKAGLHLVMANQFLEQLDSRLQTAILSNVGTLVSFRVSASTARGLEREFGGVVGAEALVDLSRGEAVARLGRAGNTVRINTSGPPPMPEAAGQAERTQRIIRRTREQLCRPRAEVEAEIFGTARRGQNTNFQSHEPKEEEAEEMLLDENTNVVLATVEPSPSNLASGPLRFGWDDDEDE